VPSARASSASGWAGVRGLRKSGRTPYRSHYVTARSCIYNYNFIVPKFSPVDPLNKRLLEFAATGLRQATPGCFIHLKREKIALPLHNAIPRRFLDECRADGVLAGTQPKFRKRYATRMSVKPGLLTRDRNEADGWCQERDG